MKSDYYILHRDADTIMELQQKVDLCYIDPPFGLGKDFTMTEADGEVKEFSDQWNSYDDFIMWYADIIEKFFLLYIRMVCCISIIIILVMPLYYLRYL